MSKSNNIDEKGEQVFNIHNLIEMTRRKDEELKAYIDHHLFPKKSKQSINVINENINSLVEMDMTQQVLIKSRAKSFEESNDPSKYFPSFLTILGFIILLYAVLRDFTDNNDAVVFLSIVVISMLIIVPTRLYMKTVKIRTTAVFFNTLINSIVYKNSNEF